MRNFRLAGDVGFLDEEPEESATGRLGLGFGAVCAMAPTSALADAQPTFAIGFDPARVVAGGTSQLTFTIASPPGGPAQQGRLLVPLPFGLDVAAGTQPACGGTLTTTSAQDAPGSYPTPAPTGGLIDLQGATVSPGSICQFSVSVTAADADPYTVTAYTEFPEGDAGTPVAATSLTVNPTAKPPEVTAAFSPRIVPFGPESSLTVTITNPNSTPLGFPSV